jgi:hypothetical protein
MPRAQQFQILPDAVSVRDREDKKCTTSVRTGTALVSPRTLPRRTPGAALAKTTKQRGQYQDILCRNRLIGVTALMCGIATGFVLAVVCVLFWPQQQDTCVRKVSCSSSNSTGRLGNSLLDLSGVLTQAVKANLCFARVPKWEVKYLQQILDFPNDAVIDMSEATRSLAAPRQGSTGALECVSDKYDASDILTGREALQDLFVRSGKLRCNAAERPELGPQGVVLHMRSGDIMKPWKVAELAPQPPCSFYNSVVETGNNGGAFDHVLIVTEQDFRNPCIQALHNALSARVKVQAHSVSEDACVMVTAQNLAISGWSNWGTGLSRLSSHLTNLHIPMGLDNHTRYDTTPGFPPEWVNTAKREDGLSYAQHIYSFPSYQTNWSSWSNRVNSMLQYPRSLIIKRSISAIQRRARTNIYDPCENSMLRKVPTPSGPTPVRGNWIRRMAFSTPTTEVPGPCSKGGPDERLQGLGELDARDQTLG